MLAIAGCVIASGWLEQPTAGMQSLDPLVVDPQHYRLEFENEFVKVIRCRIPPHDKVAMHHHAMASVLVHLTDGSLRQTLSDGTIREAHSSVGETRLTQPATHRGENLTDMPYEYVRVDLKPAATRAAKPVATDLDPLVVDPQHYRLESENDFVKVIRCRISPHDKVAMHHHAVGSVIVFLTDQNLRQTLPDGTTREAHARAGETRWTQPATHMGENLSEKPYEYLRVDIKAAAQ